MIHDIDIGVVTVTSDAVVLVIRLVSETGLFELAVLAAGAILGVLLGGVRRLGCSLGLGRISTGCLAPLPLAMLLASAALYEPTFQGPSRTPAALAVFAYGCA